MSAENNPLVTIYVTNHNYGRFIRQSVDSVLAQTLQDIEILIIDDGSTDNSREIIAQYESNPKVTVVFQNNKGLNVTNNIALRMARGRYIMRLDADDFLEPHALTILSEVLERDPQVGMVFPDYFVVDEEGRTIDMVRRHDFNEVTVFDQPAHGACTMFRCQCLLDLGGYDESYRCQDGWDIWVRLIQRYKIGNVNLPLFYYRQHGENLTTNENRLLDTRAKIISREASRARPLSTLAVIPVRGRSADRLPSALRPLGGRPLIDWTIEAALGAETVTQVVVTTPDEAILDHVRQNFGDAVLAWRRKLALAKANTPIIDTLLDVFECVPMDQECDAMVHLGVATPFRTASHIDMANEVMRVFDTDSVIGVRVENERFYQHNGGGLQPLRQSQALRLEREELLRDPGALRLFRRSVVDRRLSTAGTRTGHIVLNQMAAMCLKSELDWEIATAVLKARQEVAETA